MIIKSEAGVTVANLVDLNLSNVNNIKYLTNRYRLAVLYDTQYTVTNSMLCMTTSEMTFVINATLMIELLDVIKSFPITRKVGNLISLGLIKHIVPVSVYFIPGESKSGNIPYLNEPNSEHILLSYVDNTMTLSLDY